MKVMITCGGTGGHITPAIAIADLIKSNVSGCEILFVGTDGGMENTLVKDAGYLIRTLEVVGLSRKNPMAVFHTVHLLRKAVKGAKEIIDAFAPDIVIGTGSYACYPALSAAISRGIPTAVHESNALPGLAVRMLASRLSRVWLGFEAAREHLPKKVSCLTVGNPLPRGFCTQRQEKREQAHKRIVLSFGGSLGAPAINEAVLQLMEQTRHMENVYHVHATGKREWEPFSRELAARGLAGDKRLEILPFISDMPRRMREATVVICRAGAMSISEIAMAGRAAVLVPSPNVTGDHQLKNAQALSRQGAAVLIEEHEIAERLRETVVDLLESKEKRREIEERVKAFAHPDANRSILEDIMRLTARK
ncbi:MAG: UDP-N-acetylglucosamine--N-acetylmuramyl-(pentapeptide) pyrophosphoryl-undecaprenol N-acetylglucosamine transferase [Ruminococcaceae bacterium]|nr:UDP-N-acetylglucosamine--N-acetylmuramyl-(pentapeptide) pyrophosphoryl-undecaprenol N-acetylglucosamine transferase [Oscillospiraceae bacterium]